MRLCKYLFIIVLFSSVAMAQTDDFGGLISVSGSGHPHAQAATCSQSGTTQTCTVTDGTKFYSTNGGEAIRLSGCSNSALNYVFANDIHEGASLVTGISSNTVTMTADSSNQTVSASSCTFSPAKFYIQTITDPAGRQRTALITPENHYLYDAEMTFPACAINFENCSATKYGATNTNCVGASAELAQWATWGFQGTGLANQTFFFPDGSGSCPTSTKTNEERFYQTAGYLNVNLDSFAANPVSNIQIGVSNTFWSAMGCSIIRPLLDYYSPAAHTFIANTFTTNWNSIQSAFNYPGTMMYTTDDPGYNNISGVGVDFHEAPSVGGPHDCDPSIMTLVSAPVMTGNGELFYAAAPTCNGVTPCLILTDPKNYTKAALESALQTEYGTIAALNTAWGTSYTTFGSSGTTVTGESFGTGDGTTTTFTHTLANNSSVSPFSVAISVAGTVVAFDCPNYTYSNYTGHCSATLPNSTLLGATVTSGSVNYSTGAASVTFATAPANGAAITVSYVQNGWQYGTGLLDESGLSASVGTNAFCRVGKPAWSATHAYTGGDIIHDATSGTWQVDVTAGTHNSGGSLPAFSTTQGNDTPDGAVTWESEGLPVCGTEAGSDLPAANMNANMAADLGTFLQSFVSQYYSVTCGVAHTEFPDSLCAGPNGTASGFSPPRQEILQAAQTGLDFMVYVSLSPSTDPNALGKYMFLTRYFTKPLINEQQFFTSSQNQTSNGLAPNSLPVYTNLADMGAAWYSLQSWMLGVPGEDGLYHWDGIGWGASHGIGGCNGCGLKDNLDNAYDGIEDAVATVPCASPNSSLSCGGETSGKVWVGGNAIFGPGLIQAGNVLWQQGTAAPVRPAPPKPGLLLTDYRRGTH